MFKYIKSFFCSTVDAVTIDISGVGVDATVEIKLSHIAEENHSADSQPESISSIQSDNKVHPIAENSVENIVLKNIVLEDIKEPGPITIVPAELPKKTEIAEDATPVTKSEESIPAEIVNAEVKQPVEKVTETLESDELPKEKKVPQVIQTLMKKQEETAEPKTPRTPKRTKKDKKNHVHTETTSPLPEPDTNVPSKHHAKVDLYDI